MNSKPNITLSYVLYENMGNDQGKLKHLFEHAFPVEERPPFSFHLMCRNQNIYGVYYKNEFAALMDTVVYKDIVYLYFLAVKKKFRKKGIASKILEDLFTKYDKDYRIYLLMEEIDEKYSNYQQRIDRAHFYTKRGFKISNIKINEFEVIYSLLNNNKEVSYNDHMEVFEYLLRENGFYPTYKKNTFEMK